MKKIFTFIMILAFSFCLVACKKEQEQEKVKTPEEIAAEKQAFYEEAFSKKEINVPTDSIVINALEEEINVTVKICGNYYSMGNESANMDIFYDGNTVYLHLTAPEVIADIEKEIEARDAVDEWYKRTFDPGEENILDGFFEGYVAMSDLNNVTGIKFVETVKVDDKDLDKVELTITETKKDESTGEPYEETNTFTAYIDANKKLIIKGEQADESQTVNIEFNDFKLNVPTIPNDITPIDADSLTFAFAIFGFFMLLS